MATESEAATIVELMERLILRLRRSAATEVSGLPVTPAQARVLETLKRSRGPLRVNQLATELGILPRSATSVLDDLESSGWVERGPDRRDRRAVLVRLTSTGAAMAGQLTARSNSDLVAQINELPQADQAVVLSSLRRISENWTDPPRLVGQRRVTD